MLLDAVVDLVALVSPAKVGSIASALRGLASPGAAPNPSALADTPAAREAVGRVVAAWGQEQASGDEVAGMLLGASETRLRVEGELSVELVWTGPTTRFVPTRRTEQVLLDLIAGARVELFLVSFVAHEVPSVLAALNDAVGRGVRLRVLLEASIGRGGTLGFDAAASIHSRVPSAELFCWREKSELFADGKVHAKVVSVDGVRALITSANLTRHALERNIEVGVLVCGGTLPGNLRQHLQALIDARIIVPA